MMSILHALTLASALLPAIDNVAPARDLAVPQSSDDAQPPASAPLSSYKPGLVRQAGVGGPVAYGRAGVLELGGGLSWTKANGSTVLTVSPSIGWFFTDNFELSGIAQVSYSRANHQDTVLVTGLVEPSVHIPVTDQVFAFGGIGVGAAYNQNSDVGVALAPRVGMNVAVGRSGILSPSVSVNWTSNNAVQTDQGTLMAVNTTWGANVGYTVMW